MLNTSWFPALHAVAGVGRRRTTAPDPCQLGDRQQGGGLTAKVVRGGSRHCTFNLHLRIPSDSTSVKLPTLPGSFFRTPFVGVDDKLLGLSPWHNEITRALGTWAKLNAASKRGQTHLVEPEIHVNVRLFVRALVRIGGSGGFLRTRLQGKAPTSVFAVRTTKSRMSYSSTAIAGP